MSRTNLAANIVALRKHLGLNQGAFAQAVGTDQPNVSKWESKGIVPGTATLARIADLAGCSPAAFIDRPWQPPAGQNNAAPSPPIDDERIPMVGIRHADAAFGLGATFTDEEPEVQVLQFPKVWVESITYSPAELLSWVRARGRSMEPTINDGDLILLDHSERKVRDQDDIWAFTVGDTRAIKRLRVKGDRFIILSDNPSVPPDEEPIDFVNIVARVVFVGKRT